MCKIALCFTASRVRFMTIPGMNFPTRLSFCAIEVMLSIGHQVTSPTNHHLAAQAAALFNSTR